MPEEIEKDVCESLEVIAARLPLGLVRPRRTEPRGANWGTITSRTKVLAVMQTVPLRQAKVDKVE